MKKNKNISWYDDNAEDYASLSEAFPDFEQIEDFVKLLPEGAKVLDAGCGGGRDTNILRHKECEVVGVDISKGLLDMARKKYPEVEFRNGDILNLPFKNGEFDGVWAHASLVHFESGDDIQKAISELSRVLKKGGVVHILLKAQIGSSKVEEVGGRVFGYWTKDEVEELVMRNGLKKIKLEQYKENERNEKGREGVEWVCFLGRKETAEK